MPISAIIYQNIWKYISTNTIDTQLSNNDYINFELFSVI